MSNRSSINESRAEARRRARLAARGEMDESWDEEAEPEPEAQQKRGLLERIIPPAPPLRGKPDPLAGFSYSGRWPRTAASLYLLRQNPLAWVAAGLIWAALAIAIPLFPRDSVFYLVVNIAQYIVLIAAGWVGWQRPWLYGIAAAILGLVAWTAYVGIFPDQFLRPGDPAPTAAQLGVYFLYQAPVQLLLGLVAGWYGGYLRRRLADQRPSEDRQRRRR